MNKNMVKQKIYNFLFFLVLFIANISNILLKGLTDIDELWNYNFARNIAQGLIPYKDFSMIVTPLFSFTAGFILKITTDKLIIMRICSVLLITIILYAIYKIFDLLKIKNEISFIFLCLFFIIFKNFIAFNYNWLLLLILLIILYKELKSYKLNNNIFETNIKNNILMGCIAGLAILCKQTVGLIIAFVFIFNKIIFVKNKEDLVKFLKIFMYRIFGVLIPIILCFAYLIKNNVVHEFISYTIKGTSEFSNSIPYTQLINFDAAGILAIIIPILLVFETILLILKKRDIKYYYLLTYSVCMLIVTFPISDGIHFIIGATPSIIILLYEFYTFFYNIYNKKRKIIKVVCAIICELIIICICIYTYNNFKTYISNKNNLYSIDQYKWIINTNDLKNRINYIDQYITNSKKDIKILDVRAVRYMIPIGRYNKDYDMFNKGNFGENGENRLIEDIKNAPNRQYFVLKSNYKENWQTPTKIVDYVKNNKNKVGEIEKYDIYE